MGMRVETEVGNVPEVLSLGFDVFGLPGDSSPQSRFVTLFYLRGYATKAAPPENTDDAITLTSALMNRVFIPLGSLASNPKSLTDPLEYVPWTVVKIPTEKRFLFRGYRNMQWRQIDMDKLDLTKGKVWSFDDRNLAIQDATEEGKDELASEFV